MPLLDLCRDCSCRPVLPHDSGCRDAHAAPHCLNITRTRAVPSVPVQNEPIQRISGPVGLKIRQKRVLDDPAGVSDPHSSPTHFKPGCKARHLPDTRCPIAAPSMRSILHPHHLSIDSLGPINSGRPRAGRLQRPLPGVKSRHRINPQRTSRNGWIGKSKSRPPWDPDQKKHP